MISKSDYTAKHIAGATVRHTVHHIPSSVLRDASAGNHIVNSTHHMRSADERPVFQDDGEILQVDLPRRRRRAGGCRSIRRRDKAKNRE